MVVEEKIRVVIVDDIAETRENIQKLLEFENDIEVVGTAGTGKDGIAVAKETKPDVIMMDINMPDIEGITATEIIGRILPFTQIIILSVQGDSNYLHRAMLAGACDFLTKPPKVDEMMAAIRRAGKISQDEKAKMAIHSAAGGIGPGMVMPTATMGKIILVYSPKGGAGCTTLAVNIALTLHNQETPTVLVDGDLQFGDVTVFVNERGKNSIQDLAPRVEELDTEILDDVLIVHKSTGMRILAAPSRPEYAESISGEQFTKILNILKRYYSYIIVDCPKDLNDVLLASLDICDLVVLITTQEIPAIKNSRLFLDVADVLKLDRKRLLFVMNKFDKRIGITPEKISKNLEQEIAAVLPIDEKLVTPSVNRGVPFMLGDKSRALPKAYLGVAEMIRQRLHEFIEEETEIIAAAKTNYSSIHGR